MDEYIPFSAAIVLYAFSPLIEREVKRAVMGSIHQSDAQMTGPPTPVPAHRKDDFIEGYLSFAIDAAQIIPATLLTAVGIALAIPHDWSPAVGAVSVLATFLAIYAVNAYTLGIDPQKYHSMRMRFKGYSPIVLLSAALNLLCIVAVAVFV
ncbi:hypothetical protein [Streptomyces litmocidini]|uniref:Uncharacterized protein n=1 Tax=Streptomyces litmocidini TaxID=67318 RepID=A0ABW7U7R3_9ACTN